MSGPRVSQAFPPSTQEITPITGGTQFSTSVSLANVTGSDMAMDTGWYDFSYSVIFSSAATSTGHLFSVNGNSGLVCDPLNVIIHGLPLAGDTSVQQIFAFNNGFAFLSTRVTTGARAIINGNMKVTTAGVLVLRFATEVAGSAITITALNGWWRKR